MYEEPSTVTLHFGLLDRVMEGAFRPGHFSGVALIVSKLFHIIEPTHAYFGQKDWQQFAVIKRLVRELKFNLTLHSVPTLRETDGLAMSSRNMRLTTAHRENAKVFYHSLLKVQSMLQSGLDFEVAKKFAREMIEEKPGFALEYLELADSENLLPLKNVADSSKPILCIAGYAGDVRLIDNLLL
jgi:pantoate--beta-alanine ligase